MIFWNVAGLKNKDRDVWNFIEAGDFVSISETWVEEQNIDFIKSKLTKKMEWKFVAAVREKKRGRARGGFLIGVKKDWLVGKGGFVVNIIDEGLVKVELNTIDGSLKIWSVYNSGNMEEYWKMWEDMDYTMEGNLLIGGDFNIRIGNEGALVDEIDREQGKGVRNSKDKVVGNGGRRMIEMLVKKRWTVANGNVEGDEEGEYTFTGPRGNTVIDYVIMNERIRDKVRKFKVEERIESDHAPISIELENIRGEKVREEREKRNLETKEILSWSEESVEIFKAQTEEFEENIREEVSMDEGWAKLKEWIDRTVVRKEIKVKKWKLGQKKWWDRECAKKKGKVKRALRNWRRGVESKDSYLLERQEWRALCKGKERDWRDREIEKIKDLKKEQDIWQYLRGSYKKKESMVNEISKEQWKEHFRVLLNGSDCRKTGLRRNQEESQEERSKASIEDEEIDMA